MIIIKEKMKTYRDVKFDFTFFISTKRKMLKKRTEIFSLNEFNLLNSRMKRYYKIIKL